MKLIIATSNKHKFKEIKKILKGLPLKLLSLADLEERIRIVENGSSFFENALKKAQAVSKKYPDCLVLGEDSGLEVNFLDFRPGIYSKRYSGKNATDEKNNLKLLKELKDVKRNKRCARYRCAVAVVKNGKLVKKCEGRLCGYIYEKLAGDGGFGYDPLFFLPKYGKTVAQIPLSEKNKISHRACAFNKLRDYLVKYLEK